MKQYVDLTPLRKVKKKKNKYFDDALEELIREYNESNDSVRRNTIAKQIYPAIYTLSESLVNMVKPYGYEIDTQYIIQDLCSHLFIVLEKVKSDRGKAYSLLTKSAFFYLVQYSRKTYKEKNIVVPLDFDYDTHRDVISEVVRDNYINDLEAYFQSWSKYCIEYVDILFESNLQKTAINFFEYIQNVKDADVLNRTDLFKMMRDDITESEFLTFKDKVKKYHKKMYDMYKKKLNWDAYLINEVLMNG